MAEDTDWATVQAEGLSVLEEDRVILKNRSKGPVEALVAGIPTAFPVGYKKQMARYKAENICQSTPYRIDPVTNAISISFLGIEEILEVDDDGKKIVKGNKSSFPVLPLLSFTQAETAHEPRKPLEAGMVASRIGPDGKLVEIGTIGEDGKIIKAEQEKQSGEMAELKSLVLSQQTQINALLKAMEAPPAPKGK